MIGGFDVADDSVMLDAALWGNASLTMAEVVSTYGSISGNHAVLDFGSDSITFNWLGTLDGLSDALSI